MIRCENCHYLTDEWKVHPETGEKWCLTCFEEWQEQCKTGDKVPEEV